MSDDHDSDAAYWRAVQANESVEGDRETTAHERVLAAHARHRRDERLRERRRRDSSACRKGAHRACDSELPCGCNCHGLPTQPPEPPKIVKRSGLSAVQRAEIAARKAAGEGTADLAREFGVTTRRIRQIAHEGSCSADEREQRRWERRQRDRQRDRTRRLEAKGTVAHEEALASARGPDPEPPRRTIYDALNEAEARLRAAERGTSEWTEAAAVCQDLRGRVWLIEERKRIEQVASAEPRGGYDYYGNPVWW